ncbi:MAG: flavodoxin domain-containing protein [Acidimicrobiia bacterium]|nr:flavodoxin domain-containing protein [Acidimicrobiia bacterium]
MRALVVYESLYGNTHTVAAAIAAGLGGSIEAEALAVDDATEARMACADLLVVGGPTHAHGMTSSTSREHTVEEEHRREMEADPAKPAHELDEAATGEGLRDWFHHLPESGGGKAASFDTRFDKPRVLTGSAAHAIARRLHHRGFILVDEPMSFFVEHAEGPLAAGEEERARQWGEVLASRLEADAEGAGR